MEIYQKQWLLMTAALLASCVIADGQDRRSRMCLDFRGCFFQSPVCILLFYIYKCHQYVDARRDFGEPECGMSTVTGPADDYTMPRIIGGINSMEREFPWTVRLQNIRDPNNLCSGAIIAKDAVLTAAHCVRNAKYRPRDLRIGYGSVTAGDLKYISAGSVHIHPLYNQDDYDNDLAIVTLSQALPLSNTTNLRTICLPGPSETYQNGFSCIITGWGYTTVSGGNYPDILQKAKVPLVTVDECRRSYERQNVKISKKQLCAGFYDQGGVGPCKGDAGGPLVCADGDKWVLYGIISARVSCGMSRRPSVYAYVPQYLDWIKHNIW